MSDEFKTWRRCSFHRLPKAAGVEKLAWTRRLYLRAISMMVLVYALVAVIGAPRWLWVVLIVGAGAWLCGFAQVNVQIWQKRRTKRLGANTDRSVRVELETAQVNQVIRAAARHRSGALLILNQA